MTWWCAASGVAWTWDWRPYPGVWALVAILVVPYLAYVRPARLRSAPARAVHWDTFLFFLGALALWLATDWPLGALGAGYLLTVHTITYILLSLVAAPLLLLGTRHWLAQQMNDPPLLGVILKFLASPLPALAIFDVALIVTHLPEVVDGLGRSQLGTFTVDMTWLVTGIVMWWPAVAPTPEVSRLARPAKMGYLFLVTLVPTIPAAFLTFSDYPIYALYELAPRVAGFPSTTDQQVAGLTMKLIGDLPLWLAFGIQFFLWAREEEKKGPAPPPAPRHNLPITAR
jgi:putative membrane protein